MDCDNRCPNCAETGRIGVEVQGVYDGMLFWLCPHCDHRWHRHNAPHLRAKAQPYIDKRNN